MLIRSVLAAIFVGWAAFLVLGVLIATARRRADRRRRLDEERRGFQQRLEDTRRRRADKPAWIGFRKFTVAKKVAEAPGVASLHLAPVDKRPVPEFRPGQFLTFQLAFPGKIKPVVRCYSLSDGPGRDHYRITVKQVPSSPDQPGSAPGLVSSYFVERAQEGDVLDVRAPNGAFTLDPTSPAPVVLMGGGIGVTPVFSMLSALVERGLRKPVWFFYGVRHGGEILHRAQLERIAKENEKFVRVFFCLSHPRPDEPTGPCVLLNQHVSVDLLKNTLPSKDFEFYVCGPPPMMDAIVTALDLWGVPPEKVHFEAFGPASAKRVGKAAANAVLKMTRVVKERGSFAVTLGKSGRQVPWRAECKTLLEFLDGCGVSVERGCCAGDCGTCAVTLESGAVTYLKPPSAPIQKNQCLPCVCLPTEPVTVGV